MGRVRTKQVKRLGREFIEAYPDDFTENFEENKQLLTKRAELNSKKLRNVIAGYITHLVKKTETL